MGAQGARTPSPGHDLVKRGVGKLEADLLRAGPALHGLHGAGDALFTALNKDTQALHHESSRFDPVQAQALSDKAVDILRAAEAGELPPRIAAASRLLSLPDVRLRPPLLGGRGMTIHAIAAAGGRHPRDHGLVSRTRIAEQPVFRLFGYAGSGKSTITRHAIEALGLAPMSRDGSAAGGVLFAAFTGKAALVMTRKGTPASTIHSLIYRVSEATPEEIARVTRELADASRQLCAVWDRRSGLFAEARLRRLELRLADIHKPRFVLNEKSLVRDAELIVLDEVSMVGTRDGARTCSPSANRSWCSAIPASCRRSRATARSPTQHPT